MQSTLDSFFKPRGVAFIGATEDPAKLGGRRYRSLVEGGFQGAIYPVNPRAQTLRGHQVYRNVRDVPDPLDLAVIVVPTAVTPETVADCAARGVPAVLMVTAGFAEVDEAGRQVEQDMVAVLRRSGARMLGPNASGLFDGRSNLNLGGSDVPRGAIGLLSQSGNLLLDFSQCARERGLGFSRQVAIGNAADVSAAEVIGDLLADPETKVVLAYLEGWAAGQGRELFETIRNSGSTKPIVFVKPGRSVVGRRAVLSHTGSLAGEERVVDAALAQCGVIRAASIDNAWDLASALCKFDGEVPPAQQVAVISDGGGHSSVLCDALGLAGLSVPKFSASVQHRLRTLLPRRCAVENPIDFAGVVEAEPEVLPRVIDACLQASEIDVLMVAGHFGGYHKIGGDALQQREVSVANEVVAQTRRGTPLIMHSIYANQALPALQVFRQANVPLLRTPEAAAALVGGLHRAHLAATSRSIVFERLSRPDSQKVEHLLNLAVGEKNNQLLEPESRSLITLYGIAVPAFSVVSNADDCANAVNETGASALKLIVAGLVHRTEAGGVHLNVSGREAAKQSYQALVSRAPDPQQRSARVLVTKMLDAELEVIVGGLRDGQFGPVVMFGLGGISVEAIADVVFRLAPLTLAEAHQMLGEIRAASLLDGFRGQPPVDREQLAQMLVRVGEIMLDNDNVAEIDLNPVLLTGRDAQIADARIILST